MRFAVLIPTYNERGNIVTLIKKILYVTRIYKEHMFSVFIVDDNSPDKTSELVIALSKKINTKRFKLHLLHRRKKEGIGQAYLFGFKYILEKRPVDYILQMDADLSHDPKYIEEFLNAAKNKSDLIVGSRYIKSGGLPKDWPWYRKFLSVFGNLYTKRLLDQRIADYTGGFNMYSTNILRELDFSILDVSGYGFLIGLKYYALHKAKKITQIPIQFHDRSWGKSKMPLNTLHKNFLYVMRLKYGI